MEDFEKQLMAYLNGAAMKIKANSEKIAKKHANKLAKVTKEDSPVGSGSYKGHYKDGWGSRKSYQNAEGSFEYTVRNSKKYQLTHLLEHGHIAANGVRVGARPHINKNAKEAINDYFKELEEHITDDV